MYVFAPSTFDYNFCLGSSILYLLSGIDSLLNTRKIAGLVNFSMIFTLFLFITSFLIPLVLFTSGAYAFYSSYVCEATAICTIALVFYHFGRYYSLSKNSIVTCNFYVTRSMISVCNVLTIVVMLIYLISFRTFLNTSDSYSNDIGDRYLVTLLYSVPTLSLLLSTYYHKEKISGFRQFFSYSKVPLISMGFAILSSLYIGDRTIPIYLSISVLFVYIWFVKSIRTSILIFLAISAGLLLYIVGQTRKGDSSLRESGISAVISYDSPEESFIEYFADFYPASEANYLFVKWRETNNGSLYYPGKLFIYLLSPIPFLPSFLANIIYGVPFSNLSSGYLSTDQYNQYIRSINGGIGTHAVGDIYVSWGIVGVCILFFLLGNIVGRSYKSSRDNIYSALIYMSLFADSIYMARASIFDCYRTIVFQIIIYLIIKQISTNR